jgi:hypothetical protein
MFQDSTGKMVFILHNKWKNTKLPTKELYKENKPERAMHLKEDIKINLLESEESRVKSKISIIVVLWGKILVSMHEDDTV